MFRFALIGAALVAITVVIHAVGTLILVRFLSPHRSALAESPQWFRGLCVLLGTVLLLVILHLIEILVCPKCKGDIRADDSGKSIICDSCKLSHPIKDGIPVMIIDEADKI